MSRRSGLRRNILGVNFFKAGQYSLRIDPKKDGEQRVYVRNFYVQTQANKRQQWDTKMVTGDEADRIVAMMHLGWIEKDDKRNAQLLGQVYKQAEEIHRTRVAAWHAKRSEKIGKQIDDLCGPSEDQDDPD